MLTAKYMPDAAPRSSILYMSARTAMPTLLPLEAPNAWTIRQKSSSGTALDAPEPTEPMARTNMERSRIGRRPSTIQSVGDVVWWQSERLTKPRV